MLTWTERDVGWKSLLPGSLKRFMSAMRMGSDDVQIGGLAVQIPYADVLGEGLEAPRLRPDPASGMVSGPVLPERPAIVPRCAQGFVSCACSRAGFFPGTPVFCASVGGVAELQPHEFTMRIIQGQRCATTSRGTKIVVASPQKRRMLRKIPAGALQRKLAYGHPASCYRPFGGLSARGVAKSNPAIENFEERS